MFLKRNDTVKLQHIRDGDDTYSYSCFALLFFSKQGICSLGLMYVAVGSSV